MSTATYTVTMIDSETAPAWLGLCATQTDVRTASRTVQRDGRPVIEDTCYMTVTTEQPEALESALEDDESVIEYEAQDPIVSLAISVGTPSDYYPEDEQRENGALG